MLKRILRKIVICEFCVGVSINQLTLEYVQHYTSVVHTNSNGYYYRSKLRNNKYKSISKSAKKKQKKL